jgi:hypothetical protein
VGERPAGQGLGQEFQTEMEPQGEGAETNKHPEEPGQGEVPVLYGNQYRTYLDYQYLEFNPK